MMKNTLKTILYVNLIVFISFSSWAQKCTACFTSQPTNVFKGTDAMYLYYQNNIKDTVGNYNYNQDNNGYLGVYQIGKAGLIAAGMVQDDGELSNSSKLIWTSKAQALGVNSKDDFLRNKKAQDKAFLDYTNSQIKLLNNIDLSKILCAKVSYGNTEDRVNFTGLLKASYFFGVAETLESLAKKDYNKTDAYGRNIAFYMLDGSSISNKCIPKQMINNSMVESKIQ